MSNSLDIVENCLSQIYECRKSLLNRKMQSVKTRIEARRKLQDKLNSISNRSELRLETNDEDDEYEELARNISSSYPTAPKPISPDSSSKKSLQRNSSVALKGSRMKTQVGDDEQEERHNENGNSSTVINKEQLEELKKEFDTETYQIEKSYMDNELEGEIDDALDALINKYFSRNLDKVEPSADVSSLRQYISQRIEYLAGLDAPPKAKVDSIEIQENDNEKDEERIVNKKQKKVIDVNNPDAVKARLRSMMKRDKSNAPKPEVIKKLNDKLQSSDEEDEEDSDAESAPTQSQGKPTVPKRVKFVDEAAAKKNDEEEQMVVPTPAVRAITPNTQKKQQEKLRIKEQYERYLQSKQKQQNTHQELNDRENLAADIQSVLESLRGTGGNP